MTASPISPISPTIPDTPAASSTMVATPLSTRLRRPLQSPYSHSPLPHGHSPSRSSPSSPSSPSAPSAQHESHQSHNTSNNEFSSFNSFGLPPHQIEEIATLFRLFDPTLSGSMDVATFEVMVRSLGFRMTRVEIVGLLEMIWGERDHRDQTDMTDREERLERLEKSVNLPTAIQFLSQRGYDQRNTQNELEMYFRIFDGGNKGYITVEDLKRVQKEVMEVERELEKELDSERGESVGSNRSNGSNRAVDGMPLGSSWEMGDLGEATFQAMIDEFDKNEDGVIDLEEFKSLLEPILTLDS